MSYTNYFKQLKTFVNNTSSEEGVSNYFLYFDYILSYVKYGCSLRDYFSYELYLKNRAGKRQYLSMSDMLKFYRRFNDKEQELVLNNKEECLTLFEDLVKREWVGQKFHNSKDDYDAFVANHNKCIVKPLSGCGGHGIRILELATLGGG